MIFNFLKHMTTRPTFHHLEKKGFIGAKPSRILEEDPDGIEYVGLLDKQQDDGKGYFPKLVSFLADHMDDAPVGIRANTERKSMNGGCDEASKIRSINPDEPYGGELKTLIRPIGNNGKMVCAHLPASLQVEWKEKVQKALEKLGLSGVGKNALKSDASPERLEKAGLGHIGNGLVNPVSTEIVVPNRTTEVYHVLDESLLDQSMLNNFVSTNAGSREMGLFFEPEAVIDYIEKQLKKGTSGLFQYFTVADIAK
jgi:hypothetical protein